jgi:trehalose-6-phosphate hydrolase
MSSTSIEHCIRYSNPEEKELSMCFNFHHLKADYKNQEKWTLQELDFCRLKQILNSWQTGLQQGNGWNALFWSNHDQPRIVSRYGNDREYHDKSAKMLAAVMYLMRGTPYVFQGEEIGMTNAYFQHIEQYADVESINYYHILDQQGLDKTAILDILSQRSRDNSRTPMQWDEGANAGFTAGKPWLEMNPNHTRINAKSAMTQPDSIFAWYKRLIALRKQSDLVALGSYRPILEDHQQVFGYFREYGDDSLLVLANFSSDTASIDLQETGSKATSFLMGNYEAVSYARHLRLRPYETVVFTDNLGG